jgi:hypothetical protein
MYLSCVKCTQIFAILLFRVEQRFAAALYSTIQIDRLHMLNTVEPGYNDMGLYHTSSIVSDVLWYQSIRHR